MKRRELEQHLRSHGCRIFREGGRHTIWMQAETGLQAPVPRHPEVKWLTARSACIALKIPLPPGK